MTQGRYYVEAIDLLLDAELHRINQERDEQVVSAIKDLVQPLGIDPRSRRLAGALRSIRTLRPGEDEERRLKVFKDRFVEFRLMGDAELSRLVVRLEERASDIDSTLYSARTRISTISTVMRPLATKWLERWREQLGDNFDYDGAAKRVNDLIQKDVTTDEQLSSWLQDVFDLFNDLVIFRKPREESLNPPKRPMGMVGEANLRIYVRNWAEWCQLNHENLKKRAQQLAEGQVGTAYLSSYRRPVDVRPDYVAPNVQSYQIQQQSTAQGLSYKVTVESTDAGAGEASRSWGSREAVLNEVADWLGIITSLWGESGTMVHVSITTTGPNGESSIRVPNKDAASAIQAVKTYIEMSAS